LPHGNHDDKIAGVKFRFAVTRTEYLGADRLIYGTLGDGFGDQKVIARLPSTVTDKIAAQTTYDFTVMASDLKFFSASNDLRIGVQPI
jgi:multiple sugar transport system ATP-binding protein